MGVLLMYVKEGAKCGKLKIVYDTAEELEIVQSAMPCGFTDRIPTVMVKNSGN